MNSRFVLSLLCLLGIICGTWSTDRGVCAEDVFSKKKIEKTKAYVDSRIELIDSGESPTKGWYYCDTLYVGPPTQPSNAWGEPSVTWHDGRHYLWYRWWKGNEK